MSQLHFTATEQYSNRVIQLRKIKKSFNFGAPGLDNINKLKLLNKNELEKSINFKLGELNFLTYHPVTLENNTDEINLMNCYLLCLNSKTLEYFLLCQMLILMEEQ